MNDGREHCLLIKRSSRVRGAVYTCTPHFFGCISFLVDKSSDDSALTPTPFGFAQGRLSPDSGLGGMPLIPSSPQGISRDGSCLSCSGVVRDSIM